MILRNLITRFGFDVDKKGVNKYNETVKGMKRSALKVAGIFGLGFGAKELWQAGQSAERASFLFKRLAQTDFQPLRQTFADTRKEINRIRKGAGNLITTKEFDRSAKDFLKTFGRGREQMKLFSDLWSFSARESAITGKNVQEIMSGLQEGIKSGDFSSLLDLPGFDQFKKKILEFQQQALDPNTPDGRIAIQNRAKAFVNIIRKAQSEQNKSLRQLPPELLEADRTTKDFKETIDKLSRTIDNVLVPVLKSMSRLFENLTEKIDKFSKKGSIKQQVKSMFYGETDENTGRSEAAQSWDSIGSDIQRLFRNNVKTSLDFLGFNVDENNPPEKFRQAVSIVNKQPVNVDNAVSVDTGTPAMQMNNTFNITNQDPETTAAIVDQRLRESVQTAKRRTIKTEDRN